MLAARRVRGNERCDLSKSERAKGVALLYPEPEKGGARKKGASLKTKAGFLIRECAELFSLFSYFDGDCQSGSFLIQRNRDKLSTRKFDVGVFTQPGSETEVLALLRDVRLTPQSRHQLSRLRRPFCANSGSHVRSSNPLGRLYARSLHCCGSECSRKKRSISLVASGPRGSV